MDDFEKRWARLRDQLGAEARGESQPRLCSQRTLFGIKSSVEAAIDQVAAEQEERAQRKLAAERQRRREAAGARGAEARGGADGPAGTANAADGTVDASADAADGEDL